MIYKESTLRRFIKDYSLPIQPATNELMPYYIELYDEQFDTKRKWELFQSTVSKFVNEEAFMNYGTKLIETASDAIKQLPAYQRFASLTDIDSKIPIQKEVRGVPYTKSVNIYNPDNAGNFFISIDMKNANYQSLRYWDPEIVFNTDTYYDFISKFTVMEYFKQSKHIRQTIFGHLDTKITRLERSMNESVLKTVFLFGFKPEDVVTFTTDEIILSINEDIYYNNPNVISPDTHDRLDTTIKHYAGIDVKVEPFLLIGVGNNTYVKVHNNGDKPTFKGGSSIYFPQVYKYFKNLPLEDRDLYFMYEKQLAKFAEPMKWEAV